MQPILFPDWFLFLEQVFSQKWNLMHSWQSLSRSGGIWSANTHHLSQNGHFLAYIKIWHYTQHDTIAYMCLWELHLEAYGLSDCHPWPGWSKNRLLSTSSWPNGPLLISPSAKVQGHGILHSSKYLWALVGPKAVLGVQKGSRGLAPQTGVWPQPYSTMQLGTWWHFPWKLGLSVHMHLCM